jgi:type VI secretion system secreted protein VgrG
VKGVQSAIVVGPGGEEIYTDKYSRVKVQFHWDRDGKNDEKSSCWIRVATLWAGKQWGGVHIPRIGQEVLVDFVDGDIDRPIIVGSVYNANTMPPYGLPDNKTQSGIKSRSSKGGGPANFNEFRFEDKMGSEMVTLHAEKDQEIGVEHDESHWVGHDRKKNIDNDETTHVKHDRTETVDNNETITVTQGDRSITVKMGNDSKDVKMGNQSVKLDMGNRSIKCDLGKIDEEAMQSITLKVGQSSIKIDQMGVTIQGMMIKIQGQIQVDVEGLMTQIKGTAMLQEQGGIVMIN